MSYINIALKYLREAKKEDIKIIEEKYDLKRIKVIPILRIYNYKVKESFIEKMQNESLVKYVEPEKSMWTH